ncbi:MAG: outer membrane protein transport protein [Sandaracinus sp.]
MRAALLALASVLALVAHARADSGAVDGESARAAALGGAVVGRAGDTSAISFNPAGIADVDRTTITLLGHAAYYRLAWARTGESGTASERAVGGYGLSLVVPLPGPEWLRRVRIGAAVHVPSSGIITVDAPPRDDVPAAPLYDARLERTAATFDLGIALPGHVDVGIGVTVVPSLLGGTYVSYDARRGATVDEGVVVRLDRDVRFGGALLLGARWAPVPQFSVGLAYRQGVALRAQGPIELRAGSILANDPLDFVDVFSVNEVALGLAFQLAPELSISADATWVQWSSYLSLHDATPTPGFHDTVTLRAGAEYVVDRWAAFRLGYALEPTPVPAQVALSSYLDADRHVLSAGFGLDLEPLVHVPLHFDLYVRGHVLGNIAFTKDPAMLPDAQPTVPGQQIDALGYPGVTGGITYFQGGLSMTLALGAPSEVSR